MTTSLESSVTLATSVPVQDPKTQTENFSTEDTSTQSTNAMLMQKFEHSQNENRQQASSSPPFNKKNKKPKKPLGNKRRRKIPPGQHGLQSVWTFWYSKKLSKQQSQYNWASTLKKIGTINTIEEFWRFYSFLKRPSDIPNNSSLSLFRGETSPMWENFPNGGCWTLYIKKSSPILNRVWEELLFACIGEWFEEPDIVGIVLNIRHKRDSITLWNKDGALRHRVGEKLRQVLRLDANCPMEYKFHSSPERSAVIRRQSAAKNNPPSSVQRQSTDNSDNLSNQKQDQTTDVSHNQPSHQQSTTNTNTTTNNNNNNNNNNNA